MSRRNNLILNLIQKNLKKDIALVIAFIVGGLSVYYSYPHLNPSWQLSVIQNSQYRICFSPHGNCTALIETEINKAVESILVQAYSFTSPSIANTLIKAHQRGVEVSVLVDRSQKYEKYTQIYNLIAAGIPLYIDRVQGIAHNKVMIIDGKYVLTGSFNWSKAAENKNAENLLLIQDPKLAALYTENWFMRQQKAIILSTLNQF